VCCGPTQTMICRHETLLYLEKEKREKNRKKKDGFTLFNHSLGLTANLKKYKRD